MAYNQGFGSYLVFCARQGADFPLQVSVGSAVVATIDQKMRRRQVWAVKDANAGCGRIIAGAHRLGNLAAVDRTFVTFCRQAANVGGCWGQPRLADLCGDLAPAMTFADVQNLKFAIGKLAGFAHGDAGMRLDFVSRANASKKLIAIGCGGIDLSGGGWPGWLRLRAGCCAAV